MSSILARQAGWASTSYESCLQPRYSSHGRCAIGQAPGGRPQTRLHAYTLKMKKSGQVVTLDKPSATVGNASNSDVKISGPQVAGAHAVLEAKGKQMFLKALVGESMLDNSYAWVDGQELRPRVAYLLASGVTLAFGSADENVMTIEYEQPSTANPMMEMMMKGMMANASPEVKKAMQ